MPELLKKSLSIFVVGCAFLCINNLIAKVPSSSDQKTTGKEEESDEWTGGEHTQFKDAKSMLQKSGHRFKGEIDKSSIDFSKVQEQLGGRDTILPGR